MENKHFIYIAEESSSEDGTVITQSWKSMKFFEKLILRIFAPYLSDIEAQSSKTNQRIDHLTELVNTLSEANIKLGKQVSQLSVQLSTISDKLNQTSSAAAVLMADHNTKIAHLDSKYKDAIDFLYRLNTIFGQYVPLFGRANELGKLQMLVNYLYIPSDDLRKDIIDASQIKSRTSDAMQSMLAEIDEFNASYRALLVDHLKEKGTSWSDSVIFPNELIYIADYMSAYNDSDIEPGAPIYVVSVGLNFPNSNSERVYPIVFKRKIKDSND